MRRRLPLTFAVFMWSLLTALSDTQVLAHASADSASSSFRDGRHDFDFEIGVWKTHLKRRTHPLSGSNEWTEYDGTTSVRKVWNGLSNLLELEVDGPRGHIEALSLRLYNPDSHQWSLNFANSAGGVSVI